MIDLRKTSVLKEFNQYLSDVNKTLVDHYEVNDFGFLYSENHIYSVLTAFSMDDAFEDVAKAASAIYQHELLADYEYSDQETH